MNRLLIGLTVLLVHTAAAYAQQSPPPGAYPPGYGPPPGYIPPGGYGPPPPAPYAPPPPPPYAAPPPRPYYYYYPPPPPPRRRTDRPLTIGGGIGFSGLQFHDRVSGNSASENGISYTFDLGFGLGSRAILMWQAERTVVDNGVSFVSQTAHLGALQLFLTDRLYVKGGLGLAQINQDNVAFSAWGGAAMGALGYELVQGMHCSLGLEASVTGARYTSDNVNETWTNWSYVSMRLNFY